MVRIERIESGKKRFLDLLLLADPDEDMVDRYLEAGDMYVLYENDAPVCEAVVMAREDGQLELKNIATDEAHQNKGHARRLIAHIRQRYADRYELLYVGTADAGVVIYEKLGFTRSYVLPNFFVDNYPEPIFDGGMQCVDMIYLSIKTGGENEMEAER